MACIRFPRHRIVRTTINFFLGYRVKTTMSTTMTRVRSILPTRLQRARFATIARDPSFRRYFASGDDSATIRGVLKQLYGAAGNTKRSAALDRQLAREARSRRALVGARRVIDIDSRGGRKRRGKRRRCLRMAS